MMNYRALEVRFLQQKYKRSHRGCSWRYLVLNQRLRLCLTKRHTIIQIIFRIPNSIPDSFYTVQTQKSAVRAWQKSEQVALFSSWLSSSPNFILRNLSHYVIVSIILVFASFTPTQLEFQHSISCLTVITSNNSF